MTPRPRTSETIISIIISIIIISIISISIISSALSSLPATLLQSALFLSDSRSLTRCDKDCEESWLYVEFLKEDINGNITEILTNFKTTTDGDKAVTKTMEKV